MLLKAFIAYLETNFSQSQRSTLINFFQYLIHLEENLVDIDLGRKSTADNFKFKLTTIPKDASNVRIIADLLESADQLVKRLNAFDTRKKNQIIKGMLTKLADFEATESIEATDFMDEIEQQLKPYEASTSVATPIETAPTILIATANISEDLLDIVKAFKNSIKKIIAFNTTKTIRIEFNNSDHIKFAASLNDFISAHPQIYGKYGCVELTKNAVTMNRELFDAISNHYDQLFIAKIPPVLAKRSVLKSLRADKNTFVLNFFTSVTRYGLTPAQFNLRRVAKGKFTITPKGIFNREYQNPNRTPETHQEKKLFSQQQSVTLCLPTVKPVPFQFNSDRSQIIGGVAFDCSPEVFQARRFFKFDAGTVERRYDSDDLKYLKIYGEDKKGKFFSNLGELEESLIKSASAEQFRHHNEILARLRWSLDPTKSQLFIGDASLESKIFIQELDKLLLEKLKQRAEANGEAWDENYQCAIYYYMPSNAAHNKPYNILQQLKDRHTAQWRAENRLHNIIAKKKYTLLLACTCDQLKKHLSRELFLKIINDEQLFIAEILANRMGEEFIKTFSSEKYSFRNLEEKLQNAARNNHLAILSFIIDTEEKQIDCKIPLAEAIKNDQVEVIDLLFAKFIPSESVTEYGLATAFSHDKLNAMRTLAKYIENPFSQRFTKNNCSYSAFEIFCFKGLTEVATTFLLTKQINPEKLEKYAEGICYVLCTLIENSNYCLTSDALSLLNLYVFNTPSVDLLLYTALHQRYEAFAKLLDNHTHGIKFLEEKYWQRALEYCIDNNLDKFTSKLLSHLIRSKQFNDIDYRKYRARAYAKASKTMEIFDKHVLLNYMQNTKNPQLRAAASALYAVGFNGALIYQLQPYYEIICGENSLRLLCDQAVSLRIIRTRLIDHQKKVAAAFKKSRMELSVQTNGEIINRSILSRP